MKAQQGGGLENDGGAQESPRTQEQGTEPEEPTVGGARVGRSSPRPVQDQKLVFEKEVLGEQGSGATPSQESGQASQQSQDQHEQVLHIHHLGHEPRPWQGRADPVLRASKLEFAMYRVRKD